MSEGYCRKCGQPLGISGTCYGCEIVEKITESHSVNSRQERRRRNAELYEAYSKGSTITELSQTYKVTKLRVVQIIKAARVAVAREAKG